MRKQKEEEYLSGNLTAMIDVVFQLIIFFVCTVSMQDKAFDENVRLAMAPNGAAVTAKDPREVNVDVDPNGKISISRMRMSEPQLASILTKVAAEYGAQNVPVVIRGDSKTKHSDIKIVMDACLKAGIWKIKIAALKEKGG